MRKYSEVGYTNYDFEAKTRSQKIFAITLLLVIAGFALLFWWYRPEVLSLFKNTGNEKGTLPVLGNSVPEEVGTTNFLVAGLLQASRTDTDGDGIPDYQDSDDNNDGIPDTLDQDDNGNGVSDFYDPETVLLSLLQTNPDYVNNLSNNALINQGSESPELLAGDGIILEPTPEAITLATTLGRNVNLETEITGSLRAKRISHKGDILAASNRIIISGIPEGAVLSTLDIDVNEAALLLPNLSGVLPTTSGGTGTSTTFTEGSIVFAGTSGTYTEDNANFFWDNTNNRLGLGDNTPASALTVGAGDLFQVNSAGAIQSATAITASGNITFSSLTANRLVATTTGGQLVNTLSSANLQSSVTGTTGSGNLVFATSPALVTPNLGTPSAVTLTNATGLPLTTGVTGILPIANGGTNANAQITDGVTYFNGTSVTSSSGLTYNGTLLALTSGNLGIGDATPVSLLTVGAGDVFQVDGNGDIVKLKNLSYSWPTVHAVNGVLINDGSGILNWGTLGGGSITPNSLDFTEFQPQLDLDTSTDILVDGTELLSITNTGTSNSFQVSDEAGDTTPFVISSTGNVGIGEATPAAMLTVGNGDLFQVNSSGAIAAATGITSSGSVTFSALTPNRLVATTTGGQLVNTIAVADLQSSVTGTTGSGNLVFATAPTITTLTVSSGGIAVTGNSTIVGTLGSLTGLTSSGTITLSNYTSAILLTDGSGVISEYAGASCTNQFIRSLSPLGAATCATVQNTDLANSTVSYGGVTLSLGGSDATPAFDLVDATNLPIVAGTTGTLTVARGGTGAATFSAGILVGNGTNAFITRTITGNAQITVADGTGVSGNPTLSITADSIGDSQLAFNTGQNLTTASSPTFSALTVSSGGIAVTGNSTIVGTLGSLTGLTSSGTITFSALSTAGLVTNTSGGVLGTTTTIGASYITADSLDFTEFQDQLDLDASTDILITGSQVFSFTNTGSGHSFLVNDQAGDATPFVITGDGNVGIGLTSPDGAFQVHRTTGQSDVYVSTDVNVGSGNTTQLSFVSDRNGTPSTASIGQFNTGDLRFSATGNLVSPHLTILNANGNVGIGNTSPEGKLFIEKDTASPISGNENDWAIKIEDGTNDVGLVIGVNATDNFSAIQSMDPGTSWTGRALVLQPNGGNVGVGTTTPNVALEVAGLGRFTGSGAFSIGSDANQFRIDTAGPSGQEFRFIGSGNGYVGLNAGSAAFGSYAGTAAPSGGLIVSGNVGIGTTNPGSYKLDVQAGSAASRIQSSNDAPLHVTGTDTWSGILFSDADNSDPIYYRGANRSFSIGGSGATVNKLNVYGNTVIGTTYYGTAAPSNGLIVEGNVGVGTTSPGSRLTVQQSGNISSLSSTAQYGFQLHDGTNTRLTIGYDGSYAYIQSFASAPLQINNLGNNVLLNTTGGFVGVGTTSPATQLANYSSNILDANGTGSYSAGAFTWSSSGQGYIGTFDNRDSTANARNGLLVKTAATDSASYIAKFESGGINRMVIRADGNIGIGTVSPSAKLDVVGGNGDGIQYRTGTRTVGIGQVLNEAALYWGSGTDLTFYSGGEWMRITSTGNVGIGTSPAAKLQVAGDIYAGKVGTASDVRFYSSSASGTGAYGRIYADNSTLGQLNIDGGGGSAATTNTVQISALTKPGVDNTYDLGTTTARWRNIYASNGLVTSGYYDLNHDNLVYNGDFESGNTAGWSTSGGTTVTTGAYSGTYAMQVTGAQQIESSDYIPVDPDYDVLQLEMYAKKTVAGGTPGVIYLGYIAYDANKVAITTSPCGTYCYFAASGTTLPADGNWHKYSATTTGEGTSYPNFPVGTKFVRILGLINYAASSDAVTLVDHITLRRINNGPLVVGNNFSSTNMSDQYQKSLIYTTASNHLILEPPSSGNVGVGTSTPGQNLHIHEAGGLSNIRLSGTASGADTFDIGQGIIGVTNAGFSIYDVEAAANRFVIDTNGNVGIGTGSPDAKLMVTNGSTAGLRIGYSGVSQNYYDADTQYFRSGAGSAFATLNSTGLAVGTMSPSAHLHVAGTGTTQLYVVNSGANANNYGADIEATGAGTNNYGVYAAAANATNNYGIYIPGGFPPAGSSNYALYIGSVAQNYFGGNIGIGDTSPTAKLSLGTSAGEGIANAIRLYDDDSAQTSDSSNSYGFGIRGSDGRLSYTAGSGGYQAFYTANTERMRILNGGDVGIGTSNPASYKLNVSGRMTATSYATGGSAVGDLTNNSPWYGLGMSNLTLPGAGSTAVQVAGYYGLNFQTASGQVVINPSGSVGIGTTAPNYLLEVNGPIGLSSGSGATYDGLISHAMSSPYSILALNSKAGTGGWRGAINFDTNYNNGSTFTAMTIRANTDGTTANVGIGTTSPYAKLQIALGASGGSGTVNGLVLSHGGTSAGDGAGIDFTYGTPTGANANNIARIAAYTQGGGGGDLLFQTAASATSAYSTKMTLTRDGNWVSSRVGTGDVGVYDPTKTQAVWSMGSSYILPADGGTTTYGSLYGLGWSYNPDYGGAGNNPQSKPGLNHQLLLMMNGVTYTALGAGIWTSGNVQSTSGINTGAGGTGTQRIDSSGNLPNTGNITFTGSNPSLTASSYMIVPGGAYFSGGTVYAEASLRARGGVSNDTATYLTISGGTSGYTYFSNNVGIGVTSPTSGALQISAGSGNAIYASTAGGSGWGGDFHNTDGGGNRYAQIAGPTYAGIFMNGNVGVGTTSPQKVLHSYAAGSATPLRIENVDNGYCDLDPGGGLLVATCSSDESLKKDVEDTGSAVGYFSSIRIRDYTFRASGDRITGVIAQEMQKIYPDLVRTGNNGLLSVESPNPWKFVKAIQELDMITTTLDTRTAILPTLSDTVTENASELSSLTTFANQLSGIVETNIEESELENAELEAALTVLLERVANIETDVAALQQQMESLETASGGGNEEGIFENGISVTGLGIFSGIVNFAQGVIFDSAVQMKNGLIATGTSIFEGTIVQNADAAGYVTVETGATEAVISFENAYPQAPVVTITPNQSMVTGYYVTEVTDEGFVVRINEAAAEDLQFSWHAVVTAPEE